MLAAHCRRSGAGIPYSGFAQFDVALELLLGDEVRRRRLGELGRRYVSEGFAWDAVLDDYERFLGAVASGAVAAA